ncbi:MAG: hypothetical protein ABIT04_06620 [Novosphingobium sp.]
MIEGSAALTMTGARRSAGARPPSARIMKQARITMRGSAAILLDASHSTWADFMNWLFAFRMATDDAGMVG